MFWALLLRPQPFLIPHIPTHSSISCLSEEVDFLGRLRQTIFPWMGNAFCCLWVVGLQWLHAGVRINFFFSLRRLLSPSITTFSALPVLFKEGLKNREAVEGTTATLRCAMTKAGVEVKWRKGPESLKPSDKYRMRQEGAAAELLIRDLQVEDTGDYTCVCGDQKTTAVLTVHGNQTFHAAMAMSRNLPSLCRFTDFCVAFVCCFPPLFISICLFLCHLLVNMPCVVSGMSECGLVHTSVCPLPRKLRAQRFSACPTPLPGKTCSLVLNRNKQQSAKNLNGCLLWLCTEEWFSWGEVVGREEVWISSVS